MYKIFHGFALVEAYQNLKKAKRLAENKSVSRLSCNSWGINIC